MEAEIQVQRLRFKFLGRDCSTCARVVSKKLGKTRGIKRVGVSTMTDSVLVDFDPKVTSEEEIEVALRGIGYRFIRTDSTLRG